VIARETETSRVVRWWRLKDLHPLGEIALEVGGLDTVTLQAVDRSHTYHCYRSLVQAAVSVGALHRGGQLLALACDDLVHTHSLIIMEIFSHFRVCDCVLIDF
jgi:hypothetical protein